MDQYGNVLYRDAAGRLHRLDGPAWIEPNGRENWYKHGKLHRLDGPAVSGGEDGWESYWVEGVCQRKI